MPDLGRRATWEGRTVTGQSERRSRRATYAQKALDEYRVLHRHLTDQGKPLDDDDDLDSSFYLNAEEWNEVAQSAQRLNEYAVQIAVMRKLGTDD